jgi:hypothetical protein
MLMTGHAKMRLCVPISTSNNAQYIYPCTGEGMEELLNVVASKLKDAMVPIHALVPYSQGDLIEEAHRCGVVESAEYTEHGTEIIGHVPAPLAGRLAPLAVMDVPEVTAVKGRRELILRPIPSDDSDEGSWGSEGRSSGEEESVVGMLSAEEDAALAGYYDEEEEIEENEEEEEEAGVMSKA